MKIKIGLIFLALFFIAGCSSGLLRYNKEREKFKNAEFENRVQIVETPAANVEITTANEAVAASTPTSATQSGLKSVDNSTKEVTSVEGKKKSNEVKRTKNNKKAITTESPSSKVENSRQPDIEDSEGFDNKRRPLVDPFRVGEKVVHEVSYLGATAGQLTFKTSPMAVVNGKKAYNFIIDLKTTSFFSRVFAVDDQVQTYVDYENLYPLAFKVNIRDSMQVKEAQSYFDFETLKANYWEHKYTEQDGHEEKKLNWSILPYSQNPFSAIYYMRVFKWVVGKEYVFRVADDQKNIVFKAKALEREKINTGAGSFNAIKLKAEVVTRGNLSNANNFYLWISDDDRKFVLKIEVKLKVGSLVSEVIELNPGH